ncbi:hypothetical protein AB2911_25290, partial [Escherichia coli]
EWVHVQLHQQKGMISLSPPTICNSALNISCEVTFRHGSLRLNGAISENILNLLIRELKR